MGGGFKCINIQYENVDLNAWIAGDAEEDVVSVKKMVPWW